MPEIVQSKRKSTHNLDRKTAALLGKVHLNEEPFYAEM
jgi:hypothetical protein